MLKLTLALVVSVVIVVAGMTERFSFLSLISRCVLRGGSIHEIAGQSCDVTVDRRGVLSSPVADHRFFGRRLGGDA